jgi:hypothetical protein
MEKKDPIEVGDEPTFFYISVQDSMASQLPSPSGKGAGARAGATTINWLRCRDPQLSLPNSTQLDLTFARRFG